MPQYFLSSDANRKNRKYWDRLDDQRLVQINVLLNSPKMYQVGICKRTAKGEDRIGSVYWNTIDMDYCYHDYHSNTHHILNPITGRIRKIAPQGYVVNRPIKR